MQINWTALIVIFIGGLAIAIAIKNSQGNICQTITGKPCPSLSPGATTATETFPKQTNSSGSGALVTTSNGFHYAIDQSTLNNLTAIHDPNRVMAV